MSQTDDAISMALSSVEMSTDFSNWDDISGFAAKITRGGGARKHGSYNTAGTDTPGLTTGPREPTELTLDIVYTEGGSDAWQALRTAFETPGAVCYLRYSPQGGNSGDFIYTTTDNHSKIIECPEPVGDFGSGDPVFVQAKVVTAAVNQTTVA
jgi:hypothetical protein